MTARHLRTILLLFRVLFLAFFFLLGVIRDYSEVLAAMNQSWTHLRNNLSSTSCIIDEIIHIDKGVKADITCRIQPLNDHKSILFDDLLEVIGYFSILLAHA